MSIRWRLSGELVCAAVTEEEPGDTYIDDRLHYQLSCISQTILADVDHESNGLWHWLFNERDRPMLRAMEIHRDTEDAQ